MADWRDDNWLKLRVSVAVAIFVLCQIVFWWIAESSHREMIVRYSLPPDAPWIGDTWLVWGMLAILGGLVVYGILLLAVMVTASGIATAIFLGLQYLLWYWAGTLNTSFEDKASWDQHFVAYLGLNFVLCIAIPGVLSAVSGILGAVNRKL